MQSLDHDSQSGSGLPIISFEINNIEHSRATHCAKPGDGGDRRRGSKRIDPMSQHRIQRRSTIPERSRLADLNSPNNRPKDSRISPMAPTRLASPSPHSRWRASYTAEPTQLQARWSAETLPRWTPAASPKRTARSSESADALGWAHVPAQATRATQESSLRRRSPACE